MSITWNGVSSDTIGVIVERIPNRYVPTRRFSPQQVAGRNGNILLVDKSFPNVEQEYEVYLSAEAHGLPSVARACAEWLMGPDGYCRLEDSYDTTVYREAFLMGGYDLENILNKFGRCTITFSCKPQKYLLTGDTPIEIPDGTTTTYTGSSVQFDGVTGASITSLSTTITPTQDLHGYDRPWPGGGGKNLFGIDEYLTAAGATYTKNGDTYTITVNSALYSNPFVFSDTDINVTLSLSSFANGTTTNVRIDILNSSNVVVGNLYADNVAKTTTVSGSKLRLNWSSAGSFTISKPQLELGSTATSFAPYSNICPISGRTGLNVYRTGKNLFDPDNLDAVTVISDNRWGHKYTAAGTYAIKAYATGSSAYLYARVQNADSTWQSPPKYVVGGNTATPAIVTITAGQTLFVYDAFAHTKDVSSELFNERKVQVALSSTQPDQYYPYEGNTYAVDWSTQAGTVYGGTVDVVTGLLTVDWRLITLTGASNETWNNYTSGIGGYYISNTADHVQEAYGDGWCNMFPTSKSINTVGIIYGVNSKYIYVMGAKEYASSVAEWRTWLASNPLQIVYELATPLTYQLTPQEVQMLLGENNVWSSSGPVSVTVVTPLGGIVTNPTPFEARPMLEVSGVGEITINGKSIQILESVSDFQIDCEAMEAEDNSKIYCMDFPELSGGENEIVGYGSITALTVTPRWWTL